MKCPNGNFIDSLGEYAHQKMAIHLAWLRGERLINGYENNPILTSLGWPLSQLNPQTPTKKGGLGDRGAPPHLKGGLGKLK